MSTYLVHLTRTVVQTATVRVSGNGAALAARMAPELARVSPPSWHTIAEPGPCKAFQVDQIEPAPLALVWEA